MELRNANPNGGNVIINNVHLMFQFFAKDIEIWVKKGILNLF